MGINKESNNSTIHKKCIYLGTLSYKQDIFSSNSRLQGSIQFAEEEVERLQEPKVMDDSKEILSSRHNRTDAHKNSQRLWKHNQVSCRFEPDRSPSLRGGSGHGLPPSNKKTSKTNTELKGKFRVFFPMESTHNNSGKAPFPRVTSQFF